MGQHSFYLMQWRNQAAIGNTDADGFVVGTMVMIRQVVCIRKDKVDLPRASLYQSIC